MKTNTELITEHIFTMAAVIGMPVHAQVNEPINKWRLKSDVSVGYLKRKYLI